MKRIRLFAVMATCLFALWQLPGASRADDGLSADVCAGPFCPAVAQKMSAAGTTKITASPAAVRGARFPLFAAAVDRSRHVGQAVAYRVTHPFRGAFRRRCSH